MTERTIPPELPNDPDTEDRRFTESAPGEPAGTAAAGTVPVPPPPAAPPVPPVPPSPAAGTTAQDSSPPAAANVPGTASSQPLMGRLAVGVGVILLGLISLFPGVLRTLVEGELWRLWPVILIVLGAVKLVQASDAKARHGAAWLLVTGVVLLVHFLPFGLSWSRGWPLWIIGAGVIDLTFPEKQRDRGIGLFLLALGTVLLLWRVDSIPEQWEHAWPLLVILLGVVLVWQALFTDPEAGTRAARWRHRRRQRRHYRNDRPSSNDPNPAGSDYQREENRHG